MAIEKKLRLTRDQLAKVLEDDHDIIRQFERLFEYVNGVVTGTDSAAFPIGFVYTQYPGKESPVDQGWLGTWTNISSEFAGDFFRSEGGDASTFESGEQLESTIDSDTHNHLWYDYQGTSSIFGFARDLTIDVDSFSSDGSRKQISNINDNYTNNDTHTHEFDEGELRPVNHTIRIWERTA